jgi:ribose transport system ATP-binding protein
MSAPIPSSAACLLEVRHVSKRFPGVQALRDVDLVVQPGEVLALIGENGAGKSTLMKILAGVQTPDEGEILLEGRTVHIDSVRTASQLGIALIHQELNLSGNLDVGANIFLGREPLRFGLIDRRRIEHEAGQYLDMVGLDVSPRTLADSLSIGRQQLVEIAKALSADARLLIMDEPTSSLSSGETRRLFEVIHQLRDRGVSIVYISHRLGEVKQLADRVTVLRDGANAGEIARQQIDHDRMVRMMVGRDISQFYVRQRHEPTEPLLEVDQLRVPGRGWHPLSFQVRGGEIVGVAGLVGAGRTEMLRVLFGVDRAEGGTVRVDGRAVTLRSPLDAIRAGMALVPEDRRLHGLILEMAVRENMSLASLRRDQLYGWLNQAAERQLTAEMMETLNIAAAGPEQIVQYLSGGNQQKVAIGKWLALRPRVLLLDEPTRGIDVGAKQEIYKLMEHLAAEGMAVLFVSSEMEEILGMSDRTLVMHEGRMAGELSKDQLSEENVMTLATGKPLAA